MRRSSSRRLLVVLAQLLVLSLAGGRVASAAWSAGLVAGSKGLAHSQPLPAAPAAPTVSCPTPTVANVKVSWTAVTHATTYTVYKSTTSATSGFTSAASGIATTSWTSGTLTAATYWFTVAVTTGTKWAGPQSKASGTATVHTSGTICTVP